MRGVIIYESMFGNTRRIAEAIADTLGGVVPVSLVRAALATDADLAGVDLVVVGAPTHAWSLPRANTRQGARNNVAKPGSDLELEPDADSLPGVREWLDSLGQVHLLGAVFDTRFRAPALLTGRASRAIARSLRDRGVDVVMPPESFLVDRRNHMVAGEVERARAWGLQLGDEIARRARASR